MTEVVFLSIALSMDAFAVSIGLGAKTRRSHGVLALKAGLFFGFFQMIMPVIGYLGGKGVLGWVESYAHLIAFCLLGFIGFKMFYESFTTLDDAEDKVAATYRVLILLSIATSIDALAAGFSLNLLSFDPYAACALIGVVTSVFSFIGVFIGKQTGTLFEVHAERFGGAILLLLGVKILLI